MIRMAALITVLATIALAGCATPEKSSKQAQEDEFLTGSRIAMKTPNPTAMVKTIGSRQNIEDAMRNNSLYFLAKPARITP